MSDLIAPTESKPGLEGSGVVGDLVHTAQDLREDAISWNTAFDAAMIGFDYLSWAENPLGGLIAAGVGWLMEHLPGLSQVWDMLTGDASKIEQTAATWENIAHAIDAAKETFASASGQIDLWSGNASESYRATAQAYEGSLGSTATQAEAFAYVTKGIGGLVATVKDLVYTIIAEFIEFTVIPSILAALAAAGFTFGGSIGVAITYIEIQADIAGIQVTARIATGAQECIVVSERTAKAITKLMTMEQALKTLGEEVEKNKSWAKEALKAAAHNETEQGKGAATPPANAE